jgi:phage tail-like protein
MATDQHMGAQAIPAFRFAVSIEGESQAVFTECTLPVIEWEVEPVKEGGLNTFVYQLPGRRKPATVSLKNGIGNKELLKWYFEAMSEKFSRKNVSITLLDSRKKKVMVWDINDALPIKWTGPQLQANSNAIAIQTLELACGEIKVSPPEP